MMHARNAPGPGPWELVSRIPGLHEKVLSYLVADHVRFGDVVRYNRVGRLMQSFAHPDHVRHVLETNHMNYRRSVIYEKMRPVLGNGLVTSDGAFWQRQRRLMQPAFAKTRVAAVTGLVLEEVEISARRLSSVAGRSVDVLNEMMRLTLAIAGRALFHADVSGAADVIGRALYTALVEVDRRIDEIWNWPAWLPVKRNRDFDAAVRDLDRVVLGIIEERRRNPGAADDVLSILLAARDPETGAGMDDRQIRDEVLTLLMAGHETTANWLAWTWYLLAEHPDVERRLHAELAQRLGTRPPTPGDLAALPYLRQVTEEALRLFPPVWGMDRQAVADDVIGGMHVPAGSVVVLPVYVTHRHPAFWPEPGRFDPDRMSPEKTNARPRHAFFPFGGGPRQCIGQAFATLETGLIVASLAQRFSFRVAPGHIVDVEPGITLRPRHGLPMTVALKG